MISERQGPPVLVSGREGEWGFRAAIPLRCSASSMNPLTAMAAQAQLTGAVLLEHFATFFHPRFPDLLGQVTQRAGHRGTDAR